MKITRFCCGDVFAEHPYFFGRRVVVEKCCVPLHLETWKKTTIDMEKSDHHPSRKRDLNLAVRSCLTDINTDIAAVWQHTQ